MRWSIPANPLLENITAVLAAAILGAITLGTLTNFRSWTQSALDRASAAAKYLREGKDELEIRVQSRTRELADELTRSRQITDRLHLLESVALNARDAILSLEAHPTVGPGRRIIFANAAFTRLTGYDGSEAVGRTLRLLRSLITSHAELEPIRHAMESVTPVSVEVRNMRRDGVEFWADQSVVPVFAADGRLTHWVVVMRDITHERAMRESLSHRNQFLEALSDAIRERLFELFTQGSSFMTLRYGGTGLGLAITKRIVELMVGEISADGAPGDGATFTFTAVFDVPDTERA